MSKRGLLLERGGEDGLQSSREHDCWHPHFPETFVLGQMAYLVSAFIQSTLWFAIASRKHGRGGSIKSWMDHVSKLFTASKYLNAHTKCSHKLTAFRVLSKEVVSFVTRRYHHGQTRIYKFWSRDTRLLCHELFNSQSVPYAMCPHIVIAIRRNKK